MHTFIILCYTATTQVQIIAKILPLFITNIILSIKEPKRVTKYSTDYIFIIIIPVFNIFKAAYNLLV